MERRILLVGYNFHPEPTGIGKYSGEKIDWLVRQGYDCTVITSYPYYPFWKVQEPYLRARWWFKKETFLPDKGEGNLTVYRCPQYVPSRPSGLKRMLLDLSFFLSAFIKVLLVLTRQKFDSVVIVVPSFHFGLLGVIYKKIRGGKLIYHVQDLQIEAARDLGMIRSKAILKLLFRVEKFILNRADVISSISEGMVERISNKVGRTVCLFPNWVDTEKFYPIADKAGIKSKYGFDASEKIILYSGAIGKKQGLEMILDAAIALQGMKIRFVICGAGPFKAALEEEVNRFGIKNVSFMPLQPSSTFNEFLNMADVHLVIQKGDASDLVMPSKLTTILAVGGVSVITANPGSSLFSMVEHHKMGILVPPENTEHFIAGLLKALGLHGTVISENARCYSKEYLNINSVMVKFEQTVFGSQFNSINPTNKRETQEEEYEGVIT